MPAPSLFGRLAKMQRLHPERFRLGGSYAPGTLPLGPDLVERDPAHLRRRGQRWLAAARRTRSAEVRADFVQRARVCFDAAELEDSHVS